MTRNELLTATLPALRSWLKANDAYKGHSRDSLEAMREHALVIWYTTAEPAACVPEPAKPAPSENEGEILEGSTPEHMQVRNPRPAKPAKAKRGEGRKARPATIAKLCKAIASAAALPSGEVSLNAESLALAGLGVQWARISNRALSNPDNHRAQALAACGYIGRCTKGVLVLLPLAAEEAAA